MKQIKVIIFIFGISVLLSNALICAAQNDVEKKNPCSEDIAKFCKDAKDWMSIMSCLEANETKLSAACRKYEAKSHGKRAEKGEDVREKKKFLKVCKADIVKFCKDADIKAGGYVKCISEHKSELSAPCADWVKKNQTE